MVGVDSVRSIRGITFRVASARDAADWVCSRATLERRGIDVHLVNAYTFSLCEGEEFRSVISRAGANFPDGKPITWISRLGSAPSLNQVRGPQLFLDVVDRGRATGLRHFLLGGSERTLKILKERLLAAYPGAEIVGSYSPPFRAMTEEERHFQDNAIRKSKAQVVWVGLGTPKQDFEAKRLSSVANVVAVAVGAAFDFAAGTKREAPRWISSIGLEWLFRLLTEPRRLWKRYLVGNVKFVRAMLFGWKVRHGSD